MFLGKEQLLNIVHLFFSLLEFPLFQYSFQDCKVDKKSKFEKVAVNDSIIIMVQGTQSWNCYYESKDWVCSNVENLFFVPVINRLHPCNYYYFFFMKTKQIDIFSLEKLFVPIHLHNEEHWCLAVSKLTLILELEYNNLMKSFFFFT